MLYPITLDKERNLKYGMKAISLVEKKLKKPMSKIDLDNMTMEESAILIWSGLVHEDKNLSPERVMDLVDDYSNFPDAIESVMNAINEAFTGEEKANEESDEKN